MLVIECTSLSFTLNKLRLIDGRIENLLRSNKIRSKPSMAGLHLVKVYKWGKFVSPRLSNAASDDEIFLCKHAMSN